MSRVRSVAGKITRSGLETRTSRPPASIIAPSVLAIPQFYGIDEAHPPSGWVDLWPAQGP